MKATSGIWLIAILAILLGGMIYILFRESDIAAFHWLSSTRMDEWIREIRSLEAGSKLGLPSWVIYSLPDGLWAFAYTLIISSLWISKRSRIKWVWLSTIPLLIFGFEILQYLKILPGTFCRADLLSGAAGILAGVLIGLNLQKKRKHEKALV